TAGALEFCAVTARYAPHLPDVLRDVSLVIPARSRIGLIGRTGSGKSTIFQILFRFLSIRSGAVLVDGIDIATVPLARLRRSLAVIPQDP
ncbi:ATP-binding cassette domain-containing protein, partial [Enterococcus faecium]